MRWPILLCSSPKYKVVALALLHSTLKPCPIWVRDVYKSTQKHIKKQIYQICLEQRPSPVCIPRMGRGVGGAPSHPTHFIVSTRFLLVDNGAEAAIDCGFTSRFRNNNSALWARQSSGTCAGTIAHTGLCIPFVGTAGLIFSVYIDSTNYISDQYQISLKMHIQISLLGHFAIR